MTVLGVRKNAAFLQPCLNMVFNLFVIPVYLYPRYRADQVLTYYQATMLQRVAVKAFPRVQCDGTYHVITVGRKINLLDLPMTHVIMIFY